MTEPPPLSPKEWEFWDAWMHAQRLLTREVDRALQRDFDISKADFSILVTLHAATDDRMRLTELAEGLGWEKSRVAHQLTRMERRGLLERSESGVAGRRTGIRMTVQGRNIVKRAIRGHGRNVRRLALDSLTPEQAAAIRDWSHGLIERLGPDGE